MNTEQLMTLIQSNILIIGPYIFCILHFQKDLRFSRRNSFCIMIAYLIFYNLAVVLIPVVRVSALVTDILFFAIPFVWIRRGESRVLKYTLFILLIDIFNAFAAFLVGVAYALLGFMQGSVEWLVLDEAGIGFRIVMLFWSVLAFAIACFITRILETEVMNLFGFKKWLIIILFPVKTILLSLTKDVTLNLIEHHNNPSGIGYYLDSIDVFFFLFGIALLTIWYIRNQRSRYKELAREEAESSENYHTEVEKAKDSLHKLHHDATGWQKQLNHNQHKDDRI